MQPSDVTHEFEQYEVTTLTSQLGAMVGDDMILYRRPASAREAWAIFKHSEAIIEITDSIESGNFDKQKAQDLISTLARHHYFYFKDENPEVTKNTFRAMSLKTLLAILNKQYEYQKKNWIFLSGIRPKVLLRHLGMRSNTVSSLCAAVKAKLATKSLTSRTKTT